MYANNFRRKVVNSAETLEARQFLIQDFWQKYTVSQLTMLVTEVDKNSLYPRHQCENTIVTESCHFLTEVDQPSYAASQLNMATNVPEHAATTHPDLDTD